MGNQIQLVGFTGHVKDARMTLTKGKTYVVGRSRSADFSLRRLKSVLALSDEERDSDADLRTVSGRHFEITVYDEGSVEIVNLSPNGTYVNNKLTEKVMLSDIAETTNKIKIGTSEVLTLESLTDEEIAALGDNEKMIGSDTEPTDDDDTPATQDVADDTSDSEEADEADEAEDKDAEGKEDA